MPTQQIAQDSWEDFLATFSSDNQTRPVNIVIESEDLGVQTLVSNQPLLSVEPDLEKADHRAITVIAGDPESDNPRALTHEVGNPISIWVKEDDQGHSQALDIEASEGRTIIQFL